MFSPPAPMMRPFEPGKPIHEGLFGHGCQPAVLQGLQIELPHRFGKAHEEDSPRNEEGNQRPGLEGFGGQGGEFLPEVLLQVVVQSLAEPDGRRPGLLRVDPAEHPEVLSPSPSAEKSQRFLPG